MKLLWHSVAPWCPTGYGTQTAAFASRIKNAGHEVALSAWWGLMGAEVNWKGMRVFPGDNDWGNMSLRQRAKGFDQIITLMDVWPLDPAAIQGLPVACWVPVDHDPVPPKVAGFFKASGARPIAMSRFGEDALRACGLDPLYVPHGIDTNLFAPRDRRTVRAELGFPEDAFVVGMVANNQGTAPPRKAFPQAIAAFSEFRRQHPEAILYLHSELLGRRNGIDLTVLCADFDVPVASVRFTKEIQTLDEGISDELMARLYSAFDVLLNPSYGEGFGIPIIEAQACGTPVITTAFTSMPELTGAGWQVGGTPWYDCHQNSFFMDPYVPAIVEALEQAFVNAAGMRDKAREFALRYDADKVMDDHWTPVLELLGRPREVPPLPNRAMRRAAKKVAA